MMKVVLATHIETMVFSRLVSDNRLTTQEQFHEHNIIRKEKKGHTRVRKQVRE